MAEIKQDESGYYYVITAQSGCWENWSEVDPETGFYYPYEEHILNNAKLIYNKLSYYGWTHKPICAVLGNMIAESMMNPAQGQQSLHQLTNRAYGLCQWYPASKYAKWAQEENHSIYLGTYQVEYLDETGEDQWRINSDYNYNISWQDFISYTGTEYDVEWLASAFFRNYERGKKHEDYRRDSASWYDDYFGGYSPQPPSPDPTPYERFRLNGMPLWMMLKKRREELY